MYPKLGPGQMWETVAKIVKHHGGKIILQAEVISLNIENNNVLEVFYGNAITKSIKSLKGDYFFSTMPIKHLIRCMGSYPPIEVKEVSEGLEYRDFITVGLLLNKLKITDSEKLVRDNWIYIQEKEVKIGRLQIFNNWSPYLVLDENKVWLGLEYVT